MKFVKTAALMLALLMCITGIAFAAEATGSQEVNTEPEQKEEITETVGEPEIRTFGTEDETAVRFEITNKTNKDITAFSILAGNETEYTKNGVTLIQEILIEQGFLDDVADGSYGPKTKAAVKAFREANGLSAEEKADEEMLRLLLGDQYDDGNVLTQDEVISPDETIVIFFHEKQEEEDTKAESEAETEENKFATYQEYFAKFKLADDETEYVLHTLAIDGETMEVYLEGDVPYIAYQAADSDQIIYTYETENAILHPPVQTYSDYSDYDDYYYDYSYYDGSAYENPAQGDDGCLDDSALTW